MKKENIYLPATDKTPEVILDFERNILVMKGVLMPENHIGFHAPIYNACEEHLTNTKKGLQVELFIIYINISNDVMLHNLLFLFEKHSNMTIKWWYEDEDGLELGQDYQSRLSGLTFEFCKA